MLSLVISWSCSKVLFLQILYLFTVTAACNQYSLHFLVFYLLLPASVAPKLPCLTLLESEFVLGYSYGCWHQYAASFIKSA